MTRSNRPVVARRGGPAAGLGGSLAAIVLGYATGGVRGGAVAALAFALAVGVVFGLLWVVNHLVGRPERTDWWPVALGAICAVGLFALGSNTVLARFLSVWAYLGGATLVGAGVGAATGDDPGSGLWHGALAGGLGGVGVVYVAIYESFTMQPQLDGIVLIAAVVAPLAFGVLGGVGGAAGSVAAASVRVRSRDEAK